MRVERERQYSYICIMAEECLHGVHVLQNFGTLKCHHIILQKLRLIITLFNADRGKLIITLWYDHLYVICVCPEGCTECYTVQLR